VTYSLGILAPAGLVPASDSRPNAGVDNLVHVSKLPVGAGATGPGGRHILAGLGGEGLNVPVSDPPSPPSRRGA
jgi:predicted proteasome-type protease